MFVLIKVGEKGKRGYGYVRLIGLYFVIVDGDFMLLLLVFYFVYLFLVMLI